MGVAMRVAVTTTFSCGTRRLFWLCAEAERVSAANAALERRKDFNMTSPERVQEPARRIHVLRYSRTPRDDSILVAATVHPVIFGAPRPKTGRPCEAGFLAPGFSLSSAFPILWGSVAIRTSARRLQLRGQPRHCTAFPTPCTWTS